MMLTQQSCFHALTIKVVVFSFTLTFSMTSVADAATYYVSNNGSNENAGLNTTQPLKSIQAAMDKMRSGDTCLIRGTPHCDYNYREAVNVKADNITITNYQDEYVLVTGLDLVSGGWEKYKDFYRIQCDNPVSQLFVNQQRMDKARYPDKTNNNMMDDTDGAPAWYESDMITRNNKRQGSVDFTGDVSWPEDTWVGATLVGHAGKRTSANMGIVIASKGKRLTCDEVTWRWGAGQSQTCGEGIGYITDHLNALDAQTEWHWQDGWLYLWAPGSANPADIAVEARTRLLGLDMRGRTAVTVKGLHFKAASITIAEANGCTLSDLSVRYVVPFERVPQKMGRFHEGGAFNDWGAVPFEDGKSGVYVSGVGNTIKNMYVADSWFNGIILDGAHHLVENCLVEKVGWMGMRSVGILAYGDHITVRRNTVRYVGTYGICGGNRGATFPYEDYAKNILLEYNEIHNFCQLTADAGGIYMNHQSGPPAHSVIRYNVLHDFGPVALPDKETGEIAIHPRNITGIYLDNGSTYYEVHHNLLYSNEPYRSAICLNTADHVNIYNNTVWGIGPYSGIWVRTPVRAVEVKNNLCNKIYGIMRADQGPPYTTDKEALAFSHNRDDAKADEFVNVNEGDFRLVQGSAAIDQGMALPGINDDHKDAGPDLGAYEYGGDAWKAGSDLSRLEFIDEKPR
ncbi:right-handed parallel beta-helix repeat-containing protein [Planctomycetota bacterium]